MIKVLTVFIIGILCGLSIIGSLADVGPYLATLPGFLGFPIFMMIGSFGLVLIIISIALIGCHDDH